MRFERYRRRRVILALLAGVVVGLSGACAPAPSASPAGSALPSQALATGRATPAPTRTARPTSTADPSPSPSATPTARPTPTGTPRPTATPAATCVARTLASMTEAQRIGQLFMIGLVKDKLDQAEIDAIRRWHFGSMAFTARNSAGVAAIRTLTDAVQALATTDATAGVRFFVAANQEGGEVQTLSGPGFGTIPTALAQGSLTTAALETKAERWGAALADAGVNLDLAPVSDVVPPGTDAHNAPIGQLKREYGHDPATVASHVTAFIRGMANAGIATTAKHFPGLGRVAGNTDHTGDVDDTITTRHDPFLAPFAHAISAGVQFVMISLATYERIDPHHLAVFSPTIIDTILRGDLRFHGVVVSDALGATAVQGIPPGTRAIDFVAAGGDLLISNQTAPATEMASALGERAASDPSFRTQIDAAARRVLAAKDAAGLLACSG